MVDITVSHLITPTVVVGKNTVIGPPLQLDPNESSNIVVNAGIDPSKYTGQTTFDLANQTVRVVQDGKFWIQDLNKAIEFLGSYYQVYASGGVNGAMGYLNGTAIWKGKGTSTAVYLRNGLLREGWNTVHMEWGELRIKGPFLK